LLCGLTVEQLATASDEPKIHSPAGFELQQNFPNPFNSGTTFVFDLEQPGQVSLNIYDVRGRRITSLVKGHLSAGRHRINWQPDLASGIYIYQLQSFTGSKEYRAMRKMLLIK
jgi:hypothetical protein